MQKERLTKREVRAAFAATVPVMAAYLVLGFGFGVILKSHGYGVWWALAMSIFVYAGSMQYVGIGLLTGGASVLVTALTTLAVNARHLFYGLSMVDKYRGAGKEKAYLIAGLTDETYSLVCHDNPAIAPEHRKAYRLLVTLLNHIYWVAGSAAGSLLGDVLPFSTEGIDFALTALFLTVFVEQWLSTKRHGPALVGVASSAACLLIFGSEDFLIPAMLVIAAALTFMRRREEPADD